MQSIQTIASFPNHTAMSMIFDACRANSARQPRTLETGHSVTFTLLANGGHQACLRNSSGVVVALANVDEFDC
jgi:hypothetical protein